MAIRALAESFGKLAKFTRLIFELLQLLVDLCSLSRSELHADGEPEVVLPGITGIPAVPGDRLLISAGLGDRRYEAPHRDQF